MELHTIIFIVKKWFIFIIFSIYVICLVIIKLHYTSFIKWHAISTDIRIIILQKLAETFLLVVLVLITILISFHVFVYVCVIAVDC